MICCPHCGKESGTTSVVNTVNAAAAAAGCQPTWQGTVVVNGANPVQFIGPLQNTACAAAVVNPGTFQIIKL